MNVRDIRRTQTEKKLAGNSSLFFQDSKSCVPCVCPAQSEFVSLAEMEDTLLRNLFQGYQRWVRPIQHANDTIQVRFGLKISQLVDVVRTISALQLKLITRHFPPKKVHTLLNYLNNLSADGIISFKSVV